MLDEQSKSPGQFSGNSDATRPSFLIPLGRFVARLKMKRLLPRRSAEGSIRAGPGEPGGSRYQAVHRQGQVVELEWNGGTVAYPSVTIRVGMNRIAAFIAFPLTAIRAMIV